MTACKCGTPYVGEVAKAIKCKCGRWNVIARPPQVLPADVLPASVRPEDNTRKHFPEVLEAVGGSRFFYGMFDDLIAAVPEIHQDKVAALYMQKLATPQKGSPYFDANTWLRKTGETIAPWVNVADDPRAIDELAQRYSAVAAKLLKSEQGFNKAISYARQKGIEPQFASSATLNGKAARLECPQWWRRQIRKLHWQQAETVARELGEVSYKAGRYASFPAAKRRAVQNQANAEKLASTNLIGPDGTPIPLLEISQHNVTDKTIRRHEVLARIRGLDDYERKRGSNAQFWTITTPSKYHPTLSTGKPNPKYGVNGNPKYTAKQANEYLLALFAKLRVVLHQQEIQISGMRIAEPHHDGTPHHHYIVYVEPEHSEFVWDLMARYARQEDRDELTTEKLLEVRAKCIEIDERGVVGYVVKYVCKNLDGNTESDMPAPDAEEMSGIEAARRVDAWASHHRFKQFAFFGSKTKIMVWRALRGIAVLPDDAPADVVAAHKAARDGDYETFITAADGMALAFAKTGEVSYYDSTDIEKPFAIVNRFGEFMNLVQHNWTIVVNSALRKALAKTEDWARHYVSKWDDPLDMLIPF